MTRGAADLPDPARIAAMARPDLLDLWRRLQGAPPPKSVSVPILRKALSYEVQCRQQGGPSAARLERLERALKASSKGAAMPVGTELVRDWGGRTHRVTMTEAGPVMDGRTYRSLSAVAREITGARWSGPRFFGLAQSSGEPR
ncbi:MAG: DUF2924 domain-containing protein [Pseudomonadota bacterium]